MLAVCLDYEIYLSAIDTLVTGMYLASTLLILNCVLCKQRARWTAAQGTMAQIGIRADLLFLFVVLLGFVISPLKSVQICYSWLPCVQRCCSNRPGSSGEIQRWWWYKYKCGGNTNTKVVAIQIRGGGDTYTEAVAVQIRGRSPLKAHWCCD